MLITDCVFDGRIRTFGLPKNLEGRVRAY